MSEYQNKPKIRLATVREYKSASGKQYFSFYMANGKFLLFRDENAEPTGNAVAMWQLLIEETDPARPKPQQTAPAQQNGHSGQSRPAAWQPSPAERQSRTAMDRRAEASLRERGINPERPLVDDPIDL
jgi:hypothetical protein